MPFEKVFGKSSRNSFVTEMGFNSNTEGLIRFGWIKGLESNLGRGPAQAKAINQMLPSFKCCYSQSSIFSPVLFSFYTHFPGNHIHYCHTLVITSKIKAPKTMPSPQNFIPICTLAICTGIFISNSTCLKLVQCTFCNLTPPIVLISVKQNSFPPRKPCHPY